MPEGILYEAKNARLITRISAEKAGLGDYVVKRDFRRDLDQDIRREGNDYFWPNVTGDFEEDPGDQPFPWKFVPVDPEQEPITLIHMARRPNGQTAIIVGTKTKLWRFFGMEDGAYFEGTGPIAYFEFDNEVPENPLAYFASNSSEWQLIGSGFSEDGHRWEALNINGYTVLNNGKELPMTYRLEEAEVVPIYELREQGIASVGTIGEINGILVLADIRMINDVEVLAELLNPVGDISSVNVTGSQSTNTVTAPVDFFTTAHVGRTIVWEDDTSTKITAFTNARSVTVNTSATVTNKRFTLRNKATQAGAAFSGLVTGTVTVPAGTTVEASSAFFAAGNVGKTIRFSNGFSSVITGFTDTTHITIADSPSETITGRPFWITDAAGLNLVADADAFTAGDIGKYIVFDTGQIRKIEAFVDAKNVTVDSDGAIANSFFKLENTEGFSAFNDETNIDRIQYRLIWSMPNEPRRFSSLIPASIAAGSQTVNLAFPGKSFEAGQEVTIIGAGVEGGNLTGTILSVTQLGKTFLLSEKASTTVDAGDDTTTDDGFIERSDAVGSIVGFEDLQDDSSAILRCLALQSTLVIYKDTCIFLASFTGIPESPFVFERLVIPDGFTLYYRWTLIDVGGQFHIYAGSNRFYKFELSARTPRIIPEIEVSSDIFFSRAILAETDEIFSCDNQLTKEVWIVMARGDLVTPPADGVLCYDYDQGSVSTTSMYLTAGATIKKPVVGNVIGVTEDLFLMGTELGTLLVYGRADAAQPAWGDVKEIFYRRSVHPFAEATGNYDSILESGWGHFNEPHQEKDLKEYVLYLASQSPNTSIDLVLYGCRNVGETATTLLSYTITSPRTKNLKPVFYRQHFYKDKLTVTGKNNPCRISARSFDVDLIHSSSHPRRP